MRCIKAILAGLMVVSLSMGSISGKVTDISGTIPISGALVRLEKGGQSVTTGADGSFTLATSNAVLPGHCKLLRNGLSAGIAGHFLTVTIAERATMEIATFDLNGKALSNVRRTMDAGSHSIALPQRSTGVYLYKIKSDNGELVLKGNSVDGVSSGSVLSTQGPASNHLANQAKVAIAINDVITATKTGYLNYRCVQYTFDTTGLKIKMIASAGTVSDTDGNVYQSVRIGNQVWMTENLRVTKYNDGSAIPLDTSHSTWTNATTPKYCFYNNTTNSDSIKKYGAIYNGYVVSLKNTKKIAPTGWHVPSDAEWDTLQNYLITKGYNWDNTTTGNKIAKSLAAQTDWLTYASAGTIGGDLTKNNSSGFSALPGGYRQIDGSFIDQSICCFWWSASEPNAFGVWTRLLSYALDGLGRYSLWEMAGYPVRLVRD